MTRFDDSYRIGRCNHCQSRPSYAWPAVSGLRLEDVRCPTCHHWLDRTSREAHRMYELTPDEIAEALRFGIGWAKEQLEHAEVFLSSWEAEPVTDDTSKWRRQFNVDRGKGSLKHAQARVSRLERGLAKIEVTV